MAASFVKRLVRLIWGDWQANRLWQRILKSSISCTIAIIIAVIPKVVEVFGLSTFLIPMTAVFAHPGQRMAKMIESLLLILFGSLAGLGWGILGLYLSSIPLDYDSPGSSSIRAVFLLASVLIHGFVRSSTPRLFVFVWLFLFVAATTLIGRATKVSLAVFTNIYYPILAGAGVVLVVNVSIFPELSTSFLGTSTIETLYDTMNTVSRTTHWFMTPGGDSEEATKNQAESSKDKPSKKKTWLKGFLADFPNPFKSTRAGPSSEMSLELTALAVLAEKKSSLRAALLRCKAAQDEVNFECSISPLPPNSLKPISKHCMSRLVQNVVTLIGACENKYVLLKTTSAEEDVTEGSESNMTPEDGVSEPADPHTLQKVSEEEEDDLNCPVDDVKPVREIESGSVDLLESILLRLRGPVEEFEDAFKEATNLAMACIAYCFDVPKLPSGVPIPQGIEVEEIDLRIDAFTDAFARFDKRSTEELQLAAQGKSGQVVDLMPRMEMFLVSSFLLAFRQAATHILTMLHHTRELVDQRRKRNDRPRLWMPHYADIRQWLVTSGESDAMVLPESARKSIRIGKTTKPPSRSERSDSSSCEVPLPWKKGDEESNHAALNGEKSAKKQRRRGHEGKKPKSKHTGPISKLRSWLANGLEWAQHSDDLAYALKLSLAVFIVSWPSFVSSWRTWYGNVRGIWAPLQLVLVFEVSIGTSLFIFLVRLFGVIFGCVMGLASYEIARGNRIGMVVILIFGIVPCVYIQIATKYVKAGMIAITTMCVVALAAMNQSGTAGENFYKRLVAFLVGSVVAILVEVFIYPVRARHRLVESLSSSIRQVQRMHSTMAVGIHDPELPKFRSHKLYSRFQRAREKAQGSLAAAETFLPFCLTEPRLKGSFKPLEPIYREIIFVLHQIIDRMGNIIDLRNAYGSSILEDLNVHIYAYRRNVAASSTLMLFSVHEALTTWLPLPQFLPSPRLAQLRLVSRVRDVLEMQETSLGGHDETFSEKGGVEHTTSFVTQRSFLAWNANAAGQMEIIEYLEELVELVKLLVGVNAFRSGLLERPHYKDYVEQTKPGRGNLDLLKSDSAPAAPTQDAESTSASPPTADAPLRRVVTVAATVQRFRQAVRSNRLPSVSTPDQARSSAIKDDAEDSLPMSLRRVGSRMRDDNTAVRRRFSTASRAMS